MTTNSVLAEFLDNDADDAVRRLLLDTIVELAYGRRYFTFNVFNVLIDADSATATVEDELDIDREATLPLSEFVHLLRGGDQ